MTERQIRYTSRAQRDLRRLDPPIARRLVLAIERLAKGDPRSDVRKLSGVDEYRLRAGEWRVRFQYSTGKDEIVVHRILPRGSAYSR